MVLNEQGKEKGGWARRRQGRGAVTGKGEGGR